MQKQVTVTVEDNQRVVIMTDDMQDRIDTCVTEMKSKLVEIMQEDPCMDDEDDIMSSMTDNGQDHEIIDGSTPIYTKEITDLFYLYDNEIETAFDNHFGGEKTENWIQSGIFCHLQDESMEEVREWLKETVESLNEEREKYESEYAKIEEDIEYFEHTDEALISYESHEIDDNLARLLPIVDDGEEEYVEGKLKEWLTKLNDNI